MITFQKHLFAYVAMAKINLKMNKNVNPMTKLTRNAALDKFATQNFPKCISEIPHFNVLIFQALISMISPLTYSNSSLCIRLILPGSTECRLYALHMKCDVMFLNNLYMIPCITRSSFVRPSILCYKAHDSDQLPSPVILIYAPVSNKINIVRKIIRW